MKTPPTPSPTTINGMPVWKFDGVKLTNRNPVLISDAWIHLSDLGDEGWRLDDGWELMAPRAQIETWRDDLAIVNGLNRYACRNLRIANGLKPLSSHTSIRESHVAPNTTCSDTRHYD